MQSLELIFCIYELKRMSVFIEFSQVGHMALVLDFDACISELLHLLNVKLVGIA